jgi:UPF0755 protein
VVGGAVGGAWLGLSPIIASLTAPKDWDGEGTGSVTVQIPEGSSGAAIGRLLAEKGVVKTSKAFTDAAGKDTRSQAIQPGSYRLRQHMSAAAALAMLLDPASKLTVKVVIPEGFRSDQILDALAKQTDWERADFEKALADPSAVGLPAAAKGKAEGYLFPATYSFQPADTAAQMLTSMIDHARSQLAALSVPEENQHAILTEASLVQAEAGRNEDMPKIARVLSNRLSQGMALQLDTTIHYATGKFTLFTSNKDLTVDSPYNTYRNKGLPPGPICSPGAAAITAVINPADGPWLYFVTTDPDTGLTEFAVTYEEFAVLKAKYDKWQAAHPGQ